MEQVSHQQGGPRIRQAEAAPSVRPQDFLLCQCFSDQATGPPPTGLTACVKSCGRWALVQEGSQQPGGDAALVRRVVLSELKTK